MDVAVLVTILTVVIGGSAWLSVWTHRRLWRHPTSDPYDQLVYRHGVRGFGVFMFVALVLMPFISPDDDPGITNDFAFVLLQLVFMAVMTWGVALWGGYWWGRAMASFFGLKRNDRPHK
jgi:hypothetical protein